MKVSDFSDTPSKPIEKGSPYYDELRTVFNRSIDRRPNCIFVPQSIKDVIEAVKYAKSHKLRISVKSGGHSAFGQSVIQDAIMIDMNGFKKIDISNDLKSVAVAGGVLSGELDRALSEVERAVPLGDCPDVGVAGLALGGGNGFLSRKYGPTCDLITEIELVTSNEELLKVNSKNYPDLFWAMKGGGQNSFGVVTKITFKLVKAPSQVSIYSYYWPLNNSTAIIQKMESLLGEYGDDLSLFPRFNCDYEGLPGLRIYGIYLGQPSQATKISRALVNLNTPRSGLFDQVSYYEAQQVNVSSISSNLAFHWENTIVPTGLNNNFCNLLSETFQSCPNQLGRINLDPIGSTNIPSKLNESAFYHRQEGYILSIIGICQGNFVEKEVKTWAINASNVLFKYGQPLKYQNYAGQSDPLPSYFGPYVKNLQLLKKKYDPIGLFEGLIN